MKSFPYHLFSAALTVATFGWGQTAIADDSTAPPPPPPPAAHERHGGPGRMTADQQIKRMTERLDLSAEQQGQILPILQQRDAKMNATLSDPSLPEDQRRAAVHQIRTETRAQVGALLTPDQKAKWKPMGPGRGRHGAGHGPESGPASGPAGTGDANKI